MPTNSKMLCNLLRLCRFAVGCLAVSAFAAWAADGAPKLPLPPEFLDAKMILQKVEAAETLPKEAKEAAGTQFAAIDAQFKKLWEPLEQVFAEAMAYKEQSSVRKADLRKRGEEHNAKPHLFDAEKQQAELQAYNAEKAKLDAEQEALNTEIDARNKTYTEKWMKLAEPMDEWLKGPALGDFKRVSQGLLDGKVIFTKGLAWAQMEKAYKLGEKSGQVMDNSDPNVVDARNVKPWAPGERERELAKPRVQPLYRPKAAQPPPPAPQPAAER